MDSDFEFDPDDGNNEGKEGISSQRAADIPKKRQRVEQIRTFACPFFKKNPSFYPQCHKYTLRRVWEVKAHLNRRHMAPIHCPRCMETFQSEDDRDGHVRDANCEQAIGIKLEGMTEVQRRHLAKPASREHTAEQQWYGIFDTLFPGHEPRPQSPYIDRTILDFHSFSMFRGPQILSDILAARHATTWHLPTEEHDMQAFQRRMLEIGINEIFGEWVSSNGFTALEWINKDYLEASIGKITDDRQTNQGPQSHIGYDTE